MANPTRLNTITYAGLALGGTDTYQQIHDVEVFDGEHGRFGVAFTVVVLRNDTSRAVFRAKCAAIQAAYSKIDQDLQVTFDSTDVINVTHAGNTGYNARPSFTSGPDEFRTADSQSYSLSVTVELPEDTAGRNGRRDSKWFVSMGPGLIRTMTVEAVYTAQAPSTSASAQAIAQFDNYASGLQSTFYSGVEWEQVNKTEPEVLDDQNKNAKVTAVYHEVIHRQSLAAVNDPDFVKPQIEISTDYFTQPSLTGADAAPLTHIVVQFSTGVVRTTAVSTALINSKVIPLLQAEAAAYTMASGSLIPVRSTLKADPHANTIRGAVTFQSLERSLILATLKTRQVTPSGQRIAGVLSGNPDAGDLHKVTRRRSRELTLTTVELDEGQSVFAPHSIMTAAVAACGSGWFLILTVDEGERTREELLLPNGETLDVVVRTSVHLLHYAVLDEPDDGGTRVGDRGGDSTTTGNGDALATGRFL